MNTKKTCLFKKLTDKQKKIAFGLLLGDAWLQSQTKGRTYRLRYEQGDCHKDYIHHIVDVFYPIFGTSPKKVIRINAAGNKVITWRCQSRTSPAFDCLAKAMYHKIPPKKIIHARFIEENLTPIGLAYWFMDDGGKSYYGKGIRYGLTFNTHGFSVQEVNFLITGLQEKFKLNCWMKFNKSRPIIVVSGFSYLSFLDICGEHIHGSMYHKLPCGGLLIKKK